MFKAIIIDDEAFNRLQLRFELEDLATEINIVAEAANGKEGISEIEKHQPDLIFLDVEMPEMNGFEMLEKISKPTFHTIFTTAFDKYAIKAIRFAALDYLLKPIKSEELAAALSRFKSLKEADFDFSKNYQNFAQNIKNQVFKLNINTSEGILYFEPEEILFLEGQGNYTKFYFTNKKTLLSSFNLKYYEKLLNNCQFIRTHKSLLVNKMYIEKMQGGYVFLKSHTTPLEIAKRRIAEVKEALNY